MQPLVYLVAASIDGFIADPDGSFADFPHDDDFAASFLGSLDRFAAVVMGRATWQVGMDEGVANPFPWLEVDKLVVSTTMSTPPDPAVRVTADPVTEVRRMKQDATGPVWLCGGAVLARTLLDAGLVDVVEVKHNPILLGEGIPLFARAPGTVRLRPGAHELHRASGIRTVTYTVL